MNLLSKYHQRSNHKLIHTPKISKTKKTKRRNKFNSFLIMKSIYIPKKFKTFKSKIDRQFSETKHNEIFLA